MKLERVTEDEGLKGIQPKARRDEPYARTLRAAGLGNAQHGLAWHRGNHAGLIDVIVTLREMGYARTAKLIMKHYSINEQGNISL